MKKSLTKNFALWTSVLAASSTVVTSTLPVVSAEAPKPTVTLETNVTQEGEAVEGGTLKVATSAAFEGILSGMFYESNPDSVVLGYFTEGLYGHDENFNIDDSGFAKVEFDKENKKVKITIPEGVKWHDGEPVTIDDVIFPYEVIGHKDYDGIRYGADFKNVIGMEEYHNGEADTISGLNRIDDYTLEISFKTFSNSILKAGGGISSFIEPKHAFEGIEVKDMSASDVVRKTPIGFGPFKIKSIVAGESVVYEPYEEYYRGKPNFNVQLDVVSPETVIQEMNNGNYDIAEMPTDQYESYKDAENYALVGDVQNVYTYIGFKLGTYDKEKSENVIDESRIVTNKALRQAMAYALDNDGVAEKFYQGLRFRANTLITPNFTDVYNPDEAGYTYDPEKAKALLEEAGFVDTTGDGFVETPEGEELVLNFASMSGGEIAEPLAQYYIQAWEAVGIKVQLHNGRLTEFNAFYDDIQNDNPEIDIFQAAWGTGGDPNPNGLYARSSISNYSRFVSEKHDELLAAIQSDDAFDDEFRKKAFADWQAYMNEELPVIPTLYRMGVTAVNKRVSQWDIKIGSELEWKDIYLTADAPVK